MSQESHSDPLRNVKPKIQGNVIYVYIYIYGLILQFRSLYMVLHLYQLNMNVEKSSNILCSALVGTYSNCLLNGSMIMDQCITLRSSNML